MKINYALVANKNAYNSFTADLRDEILAGGENGSKRVQLRNNMHIDVMLNNCKPEVPFFYTADWEYCWNADGSNLKNSDLDIVAM